MEGGDIVLEELSTDKKAAQHVETAPNRSHTAQVKWTGKTCAMVLVVLIASIAIIVFAILVAMIIFNPQAKESSAEMETLRQQFENLKMTVTQIQQDQGTDKEELSREGIQEMIDSSNQQFQLSFEDNLSVLNESVRKLQETFHTENSLFQALESRVQSSEQKIEDAMENSAAKIQALQSDLHTNDTAIQLEVDKRLEDLQLEMQANNIAIHTEVDQRLEELSLELNATNLQTHMDFDQKLKGLKIAELKSTINATQRELSERLVSETASLQKSLNLELSNVESQLNQTQNALRDQLAQTAMMNETVNLRLNQVDNFVSQKYTELQMVLDNASAILVHDFYQLSDRMTESLETIQTQFINAIHDAEQRLNKSNNDLGDLTGSKYYMLTHLLSLYTSYYTILITVFQVLLLYYIMQYLCR